MVFSVSARKTLSQLLDKSCPTRLHAVLEDHYRYTRKGAAVNVLLPHSSAANHVDVAMLSLSHQILPLHRKKTVTTHLFFTMSRVNTPAPTLVDPIPYVE